MAYLLVCVLLATSLVASITCYPPEMIDSARLTLIYNLIWDFREAPIRKGGKGQQFAVVCILNSEDETKFMFEPLPGDNVPAKGQFHDVYPVKESDYKNFIAAKPVGEKKKKKQHAEPQVLAKLDSLFEHYKQKNIRNASEIILFSWYCPCGNCSQMIREKLNNQTPYGHLKRTVVFATLLNRQSEDKRKLDDSLVGTGIEQKYLSLTHLKVAEEIRLERNNSFQTCAQRCLIRYSIYVPDLIHNYTTNAMEDFVKWQLSVCSDRLVTNFQECLQEKAANIQFCFGSPPDNTFKQGITQCFLKECSRKVFESSANADPPFIRVPEDLKVDKDDHFTLNKEYCIKEKMSGPNKRMLKNIQGPRKYPKRGDSPHKT